MKMTENEPILHIEDYDIDVENLARAFQRCEIKNELVVANNGLEGLAYLRDETKPNPKIILLDLNMPVMNGIEFLKNLRNDPLLRKISVFVLSTSDQEKDILESYSFNVAGYFVKSFGIKEWEGLVTVLKSFMATCEFP